MATTVTPTRARTRFEEEAAEEATPSGKDEVVEEVPVVVEGDHTPVLHTDTNLPTARGSIPPPLTSPGLRNKGILLGNYTRFSVLLPRNFSN